MISTLLAQHPALFRVLLGAAVLVATLLGAVLHRADRLGALGVLAALGLAGALVLTLSPSSAPRYAFCTVQLTSPVAGIDALANVVLMLPLALFAALRWRRPLLVLAAVSGLSALVELVQALVPALGRACDTGDWVTNTLGAVVGVLLAALVLWFVPRRDAA